MASILHLPNMHNMHVALLVLCCSLGFYRVSAVKFEEFLGYPFGEEYGYSAFPSGVDQVRGVAIPMPFPFFDQIYNFANVSNSIHSANQYAIVLTSCIATLVNTITSIATML